ncbi:MAG: MoxR family ATPase [Synechococcales cyanobacterium RM1_1_8]|nr:MoxR family ATPase [Synechococcales cyanobacterium RM1_1_8]
MPAGIDRLFANLSQTIIGKEDSIRLVLVALIGGGHALLEDVPGVGKTLLAKSLASSIEGKFQRIQCTPDLLPSDITGSNIWMPNSGEFEFLPGPVFANVLLADEINRATPRTQSALLEVMEEQQMTLDGRSRPLPRPFFVLATQNPVEYQGTFPLPEAQMDRFMLSLSLGYPSADEELRMLQGLRSSVRAEDLQPCISLEEVQSLQQQSRQVRLEDSLQRYLLQLVRDTREHPDITLGVSPRGAVALHRAAQALALIQGRDFAIPDDIKQLAPHVLAHRMIPTAGLPARTVVERLLDTVAIPASR